MADSAKKGEKGRLFSCHEACALLGCKKSHFYHLVNSGQLPAQRFGALRGIRVYEKDCEDWLKREERQWA